MEKTEQIEREVSKRKIDIVKEISDLLNKKRTILIASIKNLPASQFQEIGKNLREKAIVKVLKKNLVIRAIENSKDENLKKIKNYVKEDVAFLFSDIDSFELAAELIEKKSPSSAKAGQEAPEDIEVQEGMTDLVPGPAISELGALGIKIQIDKGKIGIKESKVIVKKGQTISEAAASIMNKLDIKPFSVGFVPLSAYDTKERKLYVEIKINKEEMLNEMKNAFSKSLALAVERLNYISQDTIKLLIVKAARNEKALKNISGEKDKSGEVNDSIQQNSEEVK
ncbi:MAG TPA: 50S ribosomal protein L10 [Candidatus Nanoarchaeia archaeon]|nr:50S ribosomal protein L10 [Candidatus Nanoarchaeia archaeon]